MEQFIIFIHEWQELAGAFLGSSLAILFSAMGYFATRSIEKWRDRIETMRKIEVDISYTLNSIHTTQEKLTYFVSNARTLINDIRAINDPRAFALNTVNFPALAGIYLDPEIPLFRVRSYYLHNKLLWIHSAVSELNSTLAGLKDDFDRVLRLNDRLIDLMRENANPNPPAQRREYTTNLEIFVSGIERFYTAQFDTGIKTLVQVKIYNEKLRQPLFRGWFTRWKHEGVNFKFFRTNEDYKKFARTLESIDRIDSEIETEVEVTLHEMRIRAEQLRNNNTIRE